MNKFYQALKEHFGIGKKRTPLYRRVDWLAFVATFLITFIGYLITLAPDLTLEDSGELAVGSYYAAVPHPPGYPVWTIYSWLFTVLLPIANVADRVAISSAFASALSCGIIALLISRGSSMLLESLSETRSLGKKVENHICALCGFVGGLIFGYNGFIWSQSVIVEVYTFSVLSLAIVMILMMRWMYAPEQRQYLYLAMFMFGICFTNHQSLLIAAMGIEMMIVLIRPTLGREILMGNSIIFLYVLYGAVQEKYANLTPQKAIFSIFIAVGVVSILGFIYLALTTKYNKKDFWHNIVTTVNSAICWLVANLFYFFMPISSMTNPPMNWGYARTVKGFFHALTRGQYESAKPTSDILVFFDQIRLYVMGAVQEFTIVFLLLALIPFIILFFRKIDAVHKKRFYWITGCYAALFFIGILITLKPHDTMGIADPLFYIKSRWTYIGFFSGWGILMIVSIPFVYFKEIVGKMERCWLAGSTSIFFCLAILLLILLNPTADKQSQDLHKVFFTASYVFIAIWIGYGLALTLGFLITQYEKYRETVIYGAACAFGLALYGFAITITDSSNPLFIATGILGLLMALGVVILLWFNRNTVPLKALLIVLLFMPVYTIMGHWWENEQRGHLFGFWFGHDMFTPPFTDKDGKPLYPEMPKDAILYGGTDPGRFCPTYMIFCESFIPAEKRRDPNFDRRDVYIITQNALADETYLDYIRAHYFRSAQKDENFFQELLPPKKYPWLKKLTKSLDNYFLAFGKKVEERRRAEGVYPKEEIYIPSRVDYYNTFMEYKHDLNERYYSGQLRPGEEAYNPETEEFPQGQVAVFAINGYLTKLIFDKNPDHEFYIEESFALDWMYPYLTPYGIIMKINREPVKQFTQEIVDRDHEFWCQYMDRLCGNWITYDTSVSEICNFAKRVYLKGDFKGYTGDMKFVRDNDAQKSFCKLRSAIAGLYWWRINEAASLLEQQMLLKEAEFAAKQAYALCPFSPEALLKLVNVLLVQSNYIESKEVIHTSLLFDPENRGLKDLYARVDAIEKSNLATQANEQINQLEKIYFGDTNNYSNAVTLASAYLNAQRLSDAQNILLTNLPKLKKQNDEHPEDPKTAMYLFTVYRLLDQGDLAREVIHNLLKTKDVSLAAVVASAQALLQLGDHEETEALLRQAHKMAPENAEILYDLAAIQALLNKPDALDNLKTAIEFNHAQMQTNPSVRDLLDVMEGDKRFDILRTDPTFPKK